MHTRMSAPAVTRFALSVTLLLTAAQCVAAPTPQSKQPAPTRNYHHSDMEDDEFGLSKADQREVQALLLTLDMVTRYLKFDFDIDAAAKRDPELNVKPPQGANATSLNDLAAIISRRKPAVRILAEHGFTPRSYLVTSFAFVGAIGIPWADGQTLHPDTNDANLKFIAEHEHEIDALMKKYAVASEDNE